MPRLGFAVSCSLLPFGFGLSILLVLLLEWLRPDLIPFELGTFWYVEQPVWTAFTDSLLLAWPPMAAGLLLTLIKAATPTVSSSGSSPGATSRRRDGSSRWARSSSSSTAPWKRSCSGGCCSTRPSPGR